MIQNKSKIRSQYFIISLEQSIIFFRLATTITTTTTGYCLCYFKLIEMGNIDSLLLMMASATAAMNNLDRMKQSIECIG